MCGGTDVCRNRCVSEPMCVGTDVWRNGTARGQGGGGSTGPAGADLARGALCSRESSAVPVPLYMMAGYWDGPEGERCPERTWLSTRVGAAAGLLGSAYRIILLRPGSALAALQMAASDTVTMATLGAVFGVTTCISAQLRDEHDSPLDYFIGGCTTGAVLGARAHSYMTGTVACLGLGTAAALMKIGNKEGWRLTGPPKL
ncbi:NADH dehydrogenase [ubiquinone] 1 alpha subcomplex subunit 11 [Coturnix japonica]|uniref:NADH dehydrogenase [ubiquinone] 1 alpha subcomplex subunit 11 n=1 Tax=Coturnix japonica TaxID=93934 RepID=A0A8C2T5F2_COTJA|nr:NADH dehydrogenase [ubiquinone] 1 alpha subcomplex subunit 11 [Coturnix japonica]